MKHDNDFASRLVGTIQERDLTPRPRWTFAARNALILLLLGISIILGALTVATSEFLLVDRDWDVARELSSRNTIATFESLPYLWFITLAILVVVTYNLLTRTRRGYRFAPVTILGGSVLFSLALGSCLYAAGIGPQAHDYAREVVPGYSRLVISHDRFWMNPRQGLLGGVVIGATTTDVFAIKDASGQLWIITVSHDQPLLSVGQYVRVIGSRTGTSTFVAETVLPWTHRAIIPNAPY